MSFDPFKHHIETVTPQKPWKPLEVTLKATGEKMVIKDYRFNPALHENGKVVGEARVAPIVDKPVVVTTETTSEVNPLPAPKEEFEALKAVGFKNLKGDDRKRYGELKKALKL